MFDELSYIFDDDTSESERETVKLCFMRTTCDSLEPRPDEKKMVVFNLRRQIRHVKR